MVFKKYSKRGGKVYGPYFYDNIRVGEKVVTRYVGKSHPNSNGLDLKKGLIVSGLILVLIAFLFLTYYFNGSPTGRATLEVNVNYKEGEPLAGDIRFNIKEGEFIPKNSQIIFTLGNQSSQFVLSELINDVSTQGSYYAEGTQLSGNGEGYGLEGSKITYPEIEFELKVYPVEGTAPESSSGASDTLPESEPESSEPNPDSSESTSLTESPSAPLDSSSDSQPESLSEDTSSTSSLETEPESSSEASSEQESAPSSESESSSSSDASGDQSSDSSDGPSESSSDSSSDEGSDSSSDTSSSSSEGITGGVISEESYVMQGKVKKGENFEYTLEPGQTAEVIGGSIKVNGSEMADNLVSIRVEGNKVIVSTDYFINERGYGQDFLGDYGLTLVMDLADAGLVAQEGTLSIRLMADDALIASKEEYVGVSESNQVPANESEEQPGTGLNESINITVPYNMTAPTNATLNETFNVSYTLSLIKEIPNIRVQKGGNVSIQLNEYFEGAESYLLNASNISALFEGDIALIVPDEGFSGSRKARFIAYAGNESLDSNEFNIFVSSGAVKVVTERKKIVVGESVKWAKNVTLDSPENISIQLPPTAENISVKTVDEGKVEEASARVSLLTGQVTIEIQLKKESGFKGWLKRVFRALTGRAIDTPVEGTAPVEVLLTDNATEYIIEYETAAPESSEVLTSEGKEVTISAPDELNYTDIIAYTDIDPIYNITDPTIVKIFWRNYEYNETGNITEHKIVDEVPELVVEGEISVENETESIITGMVVEEGTNATKETIVVNQENVMPMADYVLQEVPFDAYDLDENGVYDYVEWVVPHLSNQTYEIIMNSSTATGEYVGIKADVTHLKINSAVSPYDGLVAYYPFDADNSPTSTVAYDFAGSNTGTYTSGAYTNSSCDSGYGDCAGFDGINDYVNVPYNQNLNFSNSDSFTLSAWINLRDQVGNHNIISGGGGTLGSPFRFLVLGGAGQVYFGVLNKSGTEFTRITGSVENVGWVHVAGWSNGTHGRVYINGAKSGSDFTINGGEIYDSGNPITIGGSGYFANGSIDEVMLFNKTLSDAEISAIYNAQSARYVTTGNASVIPVQITSGNDRVNVSIASVERNRNTSLSVRLGTWDISKEYNLSMEGLVSYWNLDNRSEIGENDTYVVDRMGTANGTVTEAVSNMNGGAYLGSYDFDGVNDKVSFGNINGFKVFNKTIAFWAKHALVSSGAKIVFGNGGSNYYVGFTTLMFSSYSNGSGSQIAQSLSSSTIPLGEWHHYTYTFEENGTNVILTGYIDGVKQLTKSRTDGYQITSSATWFLGTLGASNYYSGSIDEFMFFNRSLSDSEISELYSRGRANWNYTEYQNYSNDVQFSIPSTTTNILPQVKLDSDASQFYTPLVGKNSYINTIEVDNVAPQIEFIEPTPSNNGQYLTTTGLNVNVSSSDENDHYSFLNLDSSLAGWWRMDNSSEAGENDTYVVDWSGNGNNGTVSGGVSANASGKFGGSQTFNGVDGVISVPDADSLRGMPALTISAWINKGTTDVKPVGYWTAFGASRYFIAERDGVMTFITQTSEQKGGGFSSTLTSGWNHIVGVYNGTKMMLYVNGVKDSTTYDQTGSINNEAGGNDFLIGTEYDGSMNHDATMDELLVFRRALSDEEILSLYSSSANKYDVKFNVANGNHTIQAYAVDTKGNMNSTEARTVSQFRSLDFNSPQISFLDPTPNEGDTVGELLVNISSSDENDHYSFLNLDNSLVGWYRMDNSSEAGENDTYVVDWSGNGNNGTAYNEARPEEYGRFDGAYTFDGTTDYIQIEHSSSLNITSNNVFASAWVKIPSDSSYRFVVDKENSADGYNGFALYMDDTGIVKFEALNSSPIYGAASGTTNVKDNQWHFVAGSYNGTDIIVYVDGVKEGNASYSGGMSFVDGPMRIGGRIWFWSGGQGYFNGLIDEVLIFNRSLTDAEVVSLYNTSAQTISYSSLGLSGGDHSVRAYAVDVAGNMNSTDTRTFSILSDITAPDMTVLHPTSGNYRTTSLSLNVSSTASDISTWWYSLNSGNNVTFNPNTTITAVEGTNTLIVYVNDTTNNVNSTSLSFFVDSNLPTLSFINPSPAANSITSGNVNLNVSTSDSFNNTYSFFNDGLVGWWRMDNDASVGENATRVYDWSGKGNNGTAVNGAIASSSGKFAGAYTFDGIDDRVSLGSSDSLKPTTSISYGGWIYPQIRGLSGSNSNGVITALNASLSGYNLYLNDATSNKSTCRMGNSSTSVVAASNNAVSLYEWHHVVCVYNGTNVLQYLDGVLQTSQSSLTGNLAYSTNAPLIGKFYVDNAGFYFNGSIDEVIIFNRSLSSTEVQALYNSSQYKLQRSLTGLSGTQNYSVKAVDNSGNLQSASLSWTADNIAPTLSFISPSPTAGSLTDGSEILNVSTSDAFNNTYSLFNDGLVGWWRLDKDTSRGENDTYVVDWSGNGNNGTVINATANASGRFGGDYEFDGNGDYINMGDDPELEIKTGDVTLCAWVFAKNTANPNKAIITKGYIADPRYYLKLISSNVVRVLVDDGPNQAYADGTTNIVDLNKWNHLCAVIDRDDKIYIYLNGVDNTGARTGDLTAVGSLETSTSRFMIGKSDGSTSEYFNGSIDEVIIFNRSLSSTEIQALYNSSQYQLQRSLTGLSGTQSYSVKAVDTAGNLQTSSLSWTADNTAPTLSFIHPTPENGSIVDNDFWINASASDSNGQTFSFLDDGLVGWWRMSDWDASGRLGDYKGINNGTPYGGVSSSLSSGKFGEGLVMDGVDDYVTIPDVLSNTNLTWSAWYKTAETPSETKLIVSQWGAGGAGLASWFMYIDTIGKINCGIYSLSTSTKSIKTSASYNDGNWHNTVCIYNGSAVLQYHDGVYIGAIGGSMQDSTSYNITISSDNTGGNFFNGSIDEVIIFNRSLSSTEVQALYNSSQYFLQSYISGLTGGESSHRVYSSDLAGNVNSASLTVTSDIISPAVSFTGSTPTNGQTITGRNNIGVNISSSDVNEHYSFLNLDNSLVGWWRMDKDTSRGENDTYVVDWSGNGNNGTVVNGGVANASGRFGGDYEFDGDSDYIDLPSFSQNVTQMSFSLWVYEKGDDRAEHPLYGGYWTSQGGFMVRRETSNRWSFVLKNATSSSMGGIYQRTYSAVGWTHIAGTWNGTIVKLYTNGVQLGADASVTIPYLPIPIARIGSYTGGSTTFNGSIDEVIIFNRSLSSTEILSLYNATANKYYNNFTLSDGSHSIKGYAVDVAGNMNSTDTRTFSILSDITAPDMTVLHPTSGNYRTTSLSLNVSSTASDISTWWYSLNSGNNITFNPNTTITAVEGTNTLIVYVNDTTNNVNSTSLSFFVDSNLPALSFINPSPAANSITSGNVNLNVSTSDAFNQTYSFFNDGLVGWWRLDKDTSRGENDTYVVDWSGNGNNGTVVNGGVANVSGRFGGDYSFDGINDYISLQNNLNFSQNISISLWFNVNQPSDNVQKTIFASTQDSSNRISISTRAGLLRSAYDNGTNYGASSSISDNAGWTHAVLIKYVGQNRPILYMNGVQASGIQGSYTSSAAGTVIGARAAKDLNFNGSIDEVLVFNRSLSASEIQALYNSSQYKLQRSLTGLSGTQNYSVKAVDNSGNLQTSSLSWTADNTVPAVTFTGSTPTNGQTITGTSNVGVNISSSDVNEHYSFLNLDNSLVAWYRMDNDASAGENATRVYDWSGNGNNGTVINNIVGGVPMEASYNSSGVFGKAIELYPPIGANSLKISTNYSLNLSQPFAVSIWVRERVTNWNGFVGAQFSYPFIISDRGLNQARGLIAWRKADGSYSLNYYTLGVGGTDPMENWTHLTVSGNGTAFHIFRNSINVKNVTHGHDFYDGQQVTTLFLGAGINGSLDEVLVFNRSLSSAEVLSLYNASANKYYNNFTLSDGSHSIKGYAVDVAGNMNSTETRTFSVQLDNVAPQISITYPANASYNHVVSELNYSVSDNLVLGSCWYSLDNGITNVSVACGTNATGLSASQGSNTWRIWANDSIGNVNTTSVTFVVDSIAPTLTVNNPLNKTYAAGTVTLNVSSSEIGVCKYSLDSGITNVSMGSEESDSFETSLSGLADEGYHVSYYCNDSYGNEGNASVRFIVDSVNPVVNIIHPVDGAYLNHNSSINITYNVETLNTDTCKYNLDGGVNYTLAGCANFTINASEGEHTVYIYVNSSAGLVGSDSSTFIIDLTRPVVNSLNPGSGVVYDATVQAVIFQYNISEDNAANCSLVVNNDAINSSTTEGYYLNTTPGSINSFINSLVEGSYSWNVSCIDLAGNVGDSLIRTLTVRKSVAPVDSGSSSGGGGGGGGGASPEVSVEESGISINPESLSISVVAGNKVTREITLVNKGKTAIDVTTGVEGLSNYLSLPSTIILQGGESKKIELTVDPGMKGLLTGKILFKSASGINELPVVINVRSENFLFDVAVNIFGVGKKVITGNSLKAQFNLLQVGLPGEKVDVVANYIIKDYAGNIHLEESETFYVLGAKDYVKEFDTRHFAEGKYILGVEVVYPGAFATASSHFEITNGGIFNRGVKIAAVAAVILFVIISMIVILRIIKRYKTSIPPHRLRNPHKKIM